MKLPFELEASLGDVEPNEDKVNAVHVRVTVCFGNDSFPSPASGLAIDVSDLVLSARYDGEFDILTCGCGVAGCAGFNVPIRVHHDHENNVVAWYWDAERWAWMGYPTTLGPRTTTFDRDVYTAAVERLIQTLEAHRQTCGFPLVLPGELWVHEDSQTPLPERVVSWCGWFEELQKKRSSSHPTGTI